MMKICHRQFRIVTDNNAGYECQVRFWYWPFWQQIGFVNTHYTIDDAKAYIKNKKAQWDFKSEEVERLHCD